MTKYLFAWKSVFLLVATVALFAAMENRVEAGCQFCWFGKWRAYVVATTIVKDPPLDISTAENKGCDHPSDTPPSATCRTEAGVTTVVDWDVSGSLTVEICAEAGITIGGTIGQSRTYAFSVSPHLVNGVFA